MMKINLFQYQIVWENKKNNVAKIKHCLEATPDKSDLLLLPEMSFTGFSMHTELIGEINDETKKEITKLCVEQDIAIGFGWVKEKERSENHYTVIDRFGNEIFDYIKIHPFSYSNEDKYFVGGSDMAYFELQGISFSTLICYDLRFPELFRIASRKADVIIVPANWPQKRREHWITLLRARAIENQIYIIGINCVGNIGNLLYSGDSVVVAPDGSVLLDAGSGEGMVIFDLYNDVQKYRDEFPTYRDRRDDLYIKLQKEGKA